MKSNLKHLPLAIIMLLGLAIKATAQQQDNNKAKTDSVITRLVSRLSVSQEKAAQLLTVFNYRREEIAMLRKDSALSPKERQRRLFALLALRDRKIDSALTPDLKAKLQSMQSSSNAEKAAAFQQQAQQRHEADLSNIAHKRVPYTRPNNTITKPAHPGN